MATIMSDDALDELTLADQPSASTPANFSLTRPSAEIEAMITASASGRLNEVHEIICRYMVTRQPDPETGSIHTSVFRGALPIAVQNGHIPVVSYLLDLGFELKYPSVARTVTSRSTAMLQVFLDHGWDINKPMVKDKPPPLMYAIFDYDMTKWFLDHGALPNVGCHSDLTPLSMACASAPLCVIRLLFNQGGSVEHGQLLHHAAKRTTSDRLEVIDFLLEQGAPINAVKYQNNLENYFRRYILGLGTALHQAAQRADVEMVKRLLSRGADPLIKDSKSPGRLAKDWAEDAIRGIHLQAKQRAEKKAEPFSHLDLAYPPEKDYREVIRLLQPSWLARLRSTLGFRHDFTDGKR